jgi:hypothetical protein
VVEVFEHGERCHMQVQLTREAEVVATTSFNNNDAWLLGEGRSIRGEQVDIVEQSSNLLWCSLRVSFLVSFGPIRSRVEAGEEPALRPGSILVIRLHGIF